MQTQIQILQFLESIRVEPITSLMIVITMMAETLFLSIITMILYWCVDKERSKRLSFMIFFSTGVNGIVKNIIKMSRPFQVGVVSPIRAHTATGYSFPSGHTQATTSFWVSSMIILRKKPVVILGSIFIALTGISRMYLGVHWPMDVVGALVFGIASVLVANSLIDEKGKITRWNVIGSSIAFIIMLILDIDGDLYKTVASIWGFALGAFIEQEYIEFKPVQPRCIQIVKVVFGLVVVFVIQIGLKKMFPAYKVFHMIRYALVMLWITAGAPYCFKEFLKQEE
ncbi:phosphatase PAP2 family protein [Cellulosilyticum ruminicola]|uniref:phosphatase PAP2 family protein n=1 Tax=Cellulosilyticum ruminicola TaxID=425254 RepID=UPI0006D0A716|nr:phosphatase PAP2 family protein [Cellulosilyticum ruminicola]